MLVIWRKRLSKTSKADRATKMEVNVNGDRVQIPANATIEQLLGQLELNTRAIAVEVNEQLQPRDTHATFVLSEDDRLEIVTLVGGG